MSKVIVTKEKRNLMEAESRTHFLNENAMRLCKSLGDYVGLKALGVHYIELPPGKDSTAYHFHHNEDECIFILSGEVELLLGGETHHLSAGDFIGHPAGGEPHTMKNISESSAIYLVVGQRLEDDVVDYPVLKKRLHVRGESSELVDIDESDA